MPSAIRALTAGSVLAGVLALAAHAIGVGASGSAQVWAVNLGWLLAGVAALGGSVAAARRVTPGTDVWWAWLLHVAGASCWITGCLIRIVVAGSSPSTPAAICWLGFAVCGSAQFAMRLPRRYIFGVFLLDAVPFVLLLLAVMQAVALVPASISTTHAVLLRLFPALYVLAAANAIQMGGIHLSLGRISPTVWLLVPGYCAMALAALVWAPAALKTGTPQGHLSDVLWSLGLLGIGAAGLARALLPSGVVALPVVELVKGPHALPGVAAVLGLIVMLAVIAPPDRLLILAFLLVAVVTLFIRVLLIRRDDQQLLAELTASHAQVEASAARLRVLADVTSELKSLLLDKLLQSVCDAGRELIGARYAAFGLAPAGAGRFTSFATSGLDGVAGDPTAGPPELTAHLLGWLSAPGPVRIPGTGPHPLAGLLPGGEPPLGGVLGVPVPVGESQLAGLFLAGKEGGFDLEDETLATLLGTDAGIAIANAELYAASKAQQERLASQNEQLRELDRMKDEFVALVSHELRTPLTSIAGYLELLQDGEAGSLTGRQHEFTTIIQRNSDRLLRLVDDLLFLSRVQAGELTMELADTDLLALVHAGVNAAIPVASARGITLGLAAAPVPHVQADPMRLEQLLDNLLSNAIKLTPPGGQVTVGLAADESGVSLQVTDTGLGIPEADQQHVFERFFRATNAAGKAIQGTGLGLTITKAIVDAHGGTITVRSGLNRGACFRIRFPFGPPDRAVAV
ncbi:MAG TPA: GAF domain-containing sensor histidine kinase [Streptosporangiaceae bacterium]